ncbi:major intracellular serine protease [Fictibacillus solisalsi]|uniref:Major intracellular serine protease n=1 Tax=Fictibacillus solisalsi TaxID=459525 RepID=A0A1G9U6K1_9BACL|nr:S8 family peptidase [Fictibacillus solisalsi]SDM55304.1 major intracellular serine protease [Fictibacillus solisalsi]
MSQVHLIPFKLEEVVQTAGEEIPYGIQMINAPAAWEQEYKGKDVVVAVLDTGCDVNHPDLKDRIIGGRNFTSDDPEDYLDGHYHGTHVAGTIAATLNNKLGVAGVAPEAKLLILRVLGKDGSGSYQGIIDAINYAVEWRGDNGERVRVISMSLGGPDDIPEMHEAIKNATQNNVMVVCAAGNEGDDNERTDEQAYPGYYKEVVQVGAVDEQKHLAKFSNTNDEIDLVAPGVNILSTYPGEKYAKLSGTSMATPHVSGAVAVLILKEEAEFGRELTDPEIYAQLCKNTQTIGLTKKGEGNGLLYFKMGERNGSGNKKEETATVQK